MQRSCEQNPDIKVHQKILTSKFILFLMDYFCCSFRMIRRLDIKRLAMAQGSARLGSNAQHDTFTL